MSKRPLTRLAVRLTAGIAVFGAATVLLAGITTFAMRSSSALPVDDAAPQMPNRAIKANRMASLLPVALTSGDQQASFMLASAPQSSDLEGLYNTVTAAQPMVAIPEPQTTASAPATTEPVAAAPEAKKPQAVAALPVPPEKPKRQAAATPPAPSTMLDDGAIAGLKTRLRLTTDQIEYWPAVESALREVARTQLRHTKQMQGSRVNIDVNSAEVQQLIWAAMPLLMRLRDDQKSEVRKLARIMGLEQVASQI
ncbi:hypothetical protein [Rhodoplanes sp. Z2-YC6860]|uniref:hypothetical protein n=1 Tax=Rhodoplanes sp. Z2-YC6860 TaxID=674703 RepID=UPI00078EA5E7|nr:hypothetical protein [Rhodoplanes sp. Z2-YC6860]AMN40372.1 hypothetical protein RHPLAN_19210 [Rhodoplanes sp. Z2-YC6860]